MIHSGSDGWVDAEVGAGLDGAVVCGILGAPVFCAVFGNTTVTFCGAELGSATTPSSNVLSGLVFCAADADADEERPPSASPEGEEECCPPTAEGTEGTEGVEGALISKCYEISAFF